MVPLPQIPLPPPAKATLATWQTQVNQAGDFAAQVLKAKSMFKQKNTRRNAAFKLVRQTLERMHGGLIRCAYCEDSKADEVEHFFPKDLYPQKVFLWDNYTYACGPCNGPKNNKFAIFLNRGGAEKNISPPARKPNGWKPVKPPQGSPVLLNPREDDILKFLWLDLSGTFRIDPHCQLTSLEKRRRAEYTCELLNLNRDYLLRARSHAFTMMCAMLRAYAREKSGQNRAKELARLRSALTDSSHRTVWEEMKRQRELHNDLKRLFAQVPEAVGWQG